MEPFGLKTLFSQNINVTHDGLILQMSKVSIKHKLGCMALKYRHLFFKLNTSSLYAFQK